MTFDFIKFENWLKKRRLTAKTISIYKSQLNSLKRDMPQIFDIDSKDGFLSLHSLYTEYLNGSYLLDRVTIGSAINYFREVVPFINPTRWEKDTTTVDISIYYFDKKDYFIQSIALKDLADWLSLFSQILSKESLFKISNEYSFDSFIFYTEIEKFKRIIGKDNIDDVAVRIKYKDSQFIKHKAVIGQYLHYAGMQMGMSVSAINQHPMTKKIKSKNPKKIENQPASERYTELKPLTGKGAKQIQLGLTQAPSQDYALLMTDISTILNISLASAYDIIDYINHNDYYTKFAGIGRHYTVLRSYYSIADTNAFLIKRHSHGKEGEKGSFFSKVNYNHKGYKYWCGRKECLEILGIQKTSFYKINGYIKTHLCYTNHQAERLYYKPEVKHLKRVLDNVKSINKNSFLKRFIIEITAL
ncbi:MAG: hypothetical protein IJV75_04965 [Alphaproteobacteria bacterium]|nr:hypothetical protein [Alphaproteobacteria bacterium]